jgi:hypothetical protein
MDGFRIVGFLCDSSGRHPEAETVIKILNWPDCESVSEARGFIGICVYYRIWIKNFTAIVQPIFILFRV